MKLNIAKLLLLLFVGNAYGQVTSDSDVPSASPTAITTYYDTPIQKWSVQLPSTGFSTGPRVGKGNAVTVSPDGSSLYITLNTGRLEVLSAFDGAYLWGYEPAPIAPGWTTSCKSGVTFGKKNSQSFVLYAVIDTPPFGAGEDVKSRMIAIEHPNKKVLWTTTVPGEFQGSPLVTAGQTFAGDYIFFTHNQDVATAAPYGSFSMALANTGEIIFTENAGDSPNDPDPASLERVTTLRLPYSPLGFTSSPQTGRYPGGEGNTEDIFVWSTSDVEGRGPNGYTRAFQLTRLFDPVFADVLATTFLKENRWNAIASPILSDDGFYLVFGIRANRVRGWTAVPDFDQLANLVQDLDEDPSDPRLPIPYSPVFSPSESTFFVSTTVGTLYSISTTTGDIFWNITLDSPVSSSVLVSQEGPFLYYTTESGAFAAVNQDSGEVAWSLSCADLPPAPAAICTDSILGAASLAPSELVLYLSDALGNVKALQLGESIIETDPPTSFPTASPTSSPTPAPTPAPTLAPSTSNSPTEAGRTSPPTSFPTVTASDFPTAGPTATASEAPTSFPTAAKSQSPTGPPVEVITPSPVTTSTPAPVLDSTPEPSPAPEDTSSAPRKGLAFAISLVLLATVYV